MIASASTSYAQSSTSSIQIPKPTFEKCKQAADEVVISRNLIAAQAAEIAALKENSALKDEKLRLQDEIIALKSQQLVEKDKVIVATQTQFEVVAKRNEKLERSNKRLRKVGTVLGATVGALAFMLFH